MGVIHHNAILATTWEPEQVTKVKEWISKSSILTPNYRKLFAFVKTELNGYTTVILAPDGSKESWTPSNEMDLVRDRFIDDILVPNDDYWMWVEVGYGEYGQKVTRGNADSFS